MRNILIIIAVFWLLFLNGFSTIGRLINTSNLSNVPATVVKGAQTAVSTSGVAAAGSSGVTIDKKPAPVTVRTIGGNPDSSTGGRVIVPNGMAALPTATEEYERLPTAEPTPVQAIPELPLEPVEEATATLEPSNPEDWQSGGGPEIVSNPDAPTPIPTITPQPDDPFQVGAVVKVVRGNFMIGEQGEIVIANSHSPYMMLVGFSNGDAFSFPKANLEIIIGGGGGDGW